MALYACLCILLHNWSKSIAFGFFCFELTEIEGAKVGAIDRTIFRYIILRASIVHKIKNSQNKRNSRDEEQSNMRTNQHMPLIVNQKGNILDVHSSTILMLNLIRMYGSKKLTSSHLLMYSRTTTTKQLTR